MMETRKKFYMFSEFNFREIEQELNQMEHEGWHLKSQGEFFWTFEKGEPDMYQYSTSYLPDSSEYSPEEDERREQLNGYCESAGWEKIAAVGKCNIYRNSELSAVPIETDEAERLNVINRLMEKGSLLWKKIFVVIEIVCIPILIAAAAVGGELLDAVFIRLVFYLLTFTSVNVAIIINYRSWYRASVKAVEAGLLSVDASAAGKRHMLFDYLECIPVIVFMVGEFMVPDPEKKMAIALYFLIVIMTGLHALWIRKALRYAKFSIAWNVIVTSVLSIALGIWCAVVLTGILMSRGILHAPW